MAELYYMVVSNILPVLSLVYAVLCAMLVWSYLYNARSVGLMHTLPIRREGLFVTHFLAGLTMMFIPYAITGTLCIIVSALYGGFALAPLLSTVAAVAGESFFYFASATLVAFITGNVFALPVLYGGLHFLAPAIDTLVSSLARGFLFGYTTYYSGAADWLCPTVYLMDHVGVERVYETAKTINRSTGAVYESQVVKEIYLQGLAAVGVYALVGAVCVVLAWLLYRSRRSETAGDVVAVGWLRPVFRFGVAALAAAGGGLLLYLLVWENFLSGDTYSAAPLTVCMIVAGAIGYYAASMLLEKSLRVFRGNWKGMVIVAAGCVALCCVLRFDALGVAARVPEVSQVKSVELYAAGNTYTLCPGEDDALIEQLRTVHKAIVADEDYIRREFSWSEDYEDGETYTYLWLTYNLTNGQTVYRSYTVPMTQVRIGQEGTYDQLIDALVNSREMKYKRLHAGDDRYTVDGGDLHFDYDSYTDYDLNSQQAAAIAEAVMRDCQEGTWGNYDWFDKDNDGRYALNLELSYRYQRTSGTASQDWAHDWIYISIRPDMTNTVACLKDLGLATDEDLVTYRELWAGDSLGVIGSAETSTAIVTEETHLGVIGGTDGPTTVMVG
jgi:ABC-2 type transport system permease protein